MKRWFLVFAVVALAVGLTPVSALAASKPSPATRPVTHDMSHPVKVNYPCPGMSHSGVGPTDVFNCATTAIQGISPKANSPAGLCVNNVAYIQSYNGATTWYATLAGSAGRDIESWVQYYWCPTKPGEPHGWTSINWAYGHTYPLNYCEHLFVGDYGPFANPWAVIELGHVDPFFGFTAGAALVQPGGIATDDGEVYHDVAGHCISPGPTGYIWDYSNPYDGSGYYQPHMYGNNGITNELGFWSDANWGWSVYR